jgi:hypothetical protein
LILFGDLVVYLLIDFCYEFDFFLLLVSITDLQFNYSLQNSSDWATSIGKFVSFSGGDLPTSFWENGEEFFKRMKTHFPNWVIYLPNKLFPQKMNILREILSDSRVSFQNLCVVNFQEANFQIQSRPNGEEFEEMVENPLPKWIDLLKIHRIFSESEGTSDEFSTIRSSLVEGQC